MTTNCLEIFKELAVFNQDSDSLAILNIMKDQYGYRWFENDHFQFLIDQIRQGKQPKIEFYYTLHKTCSRNAVRSLIMNLLNRIPINLGSPNFPINDLKNIDNNWYAKMGKVYSKHRYGKGLEKFIHDDELEFSRFCIVAPLDFMERQNNYLSSYAVHTWGVNLETESTYYSLRYSSLDDNGKLTKFMLAQRVIVHNMIQTFLRHSHDKGIDNQMNIFRITGIGMGMYLNTAPYQLKERMMKIFCLELFSEIEKAIAFRSDVIFILSVGEPFLTIAKEMLTSGRMFDDRLMVGSFHEYLFQLRPLTTKDFPNAKRVYYLNAWDDLSFIGNGLFKDKSLDGYFVANAYNMARSFRNNSFLHNTIFSGMPKKFIRV